MAFDLFRPRLCEVTEVTTLPNDDYFDGLRIVFLAAGFFTTAFSLGATAFFSSANFDFFEVSDLALAAISARCARA